MSATSIVTSSGDRFDPCFPDWKKIRIEDIAHALSRQTRFSGHVRGTWTVANHSLLVSQLVPQAHALAALLHDAAEAYLIDIPSPVKTSGLISGYCGVETDIHAAVEKAFNVALRASVIKNWDKAALWAEAEVFMFGWADWNYQPESADFLRIEITRNAILSGVGQPLVNRVAGKLDFYSPGATERLFLREFSRLNSIEFERHNAGAA
jgi:uncharacterized protein